MRPPTKATLTTVFSDVLANLAFMFSDGSQAEPLPGTRWLETSIAYRGPVVGTLTFHCTTEFGELLAANLLGVDAADHAARARTQDAVKEFMNIVCGQFITALHGTEHIFDLSIPQTRELDETPHLVTADTAHVSTLTVEGHRVQLTYTPGEYPDGLCATGEEIVGA
jgi:CheY-specific phosphatase CheX